MFRAAVFVALVASAYGACPATPTGGCSICGEGKCVSNPDAIFAQDGQPPVGCGLLESLGLSGNAQIVSSCTVFPLLPAISACGCASGSSPSTPTSKPVASTPAPTKKPVATPVSAPTKKPVAAPVSTPTKKPVAAPVSTPTKKPVAAPVSTSTKKPVAAPVPKPTKTPGTTSAPKPTKTPKPTKKPVAPSVAKPTVVPAPTVAMKGMKGMMTMAVTMGKAAV